MHIWTQMTPGAQVSLFSKEIVKVPVEKLISAPLTWQKNKLTKQFNKYIQLYIFCSVSGNDVFYNKGMHEL